MRRIVFTYHTGYCGMDGHDFRMYPDDVTEEELWDDAWEGALSNAESYGIYPYPDDFTEDEDEDPEYGQSDSYSDNIEGYWEDFDYEKHEGLVAGGGSATKLFEKLEKDF